MLNIETKVDSAEKLAAVAGKPTENFLFAEEFNKIVAKVNEQEEFKADLVGGKVPASQLPSYVDDVLEFANLATFPATGETGKIYLSLDTNSTYRWSGSSYIPLNSGIEFPTSDNKIYGVKNGLAKRIDLLLTDNFISGNAINVSPNFVIIGSSYNGSFIGTQTGNITFLGIIPSLKIVSASSLGAFSNYSQNIVRGFLSTLKSKLKTETFFSIANSVAPTSSRMSVGFITYANGSMGNINPSGASILAFCNDNGEDYLKLCHRTIAGITQTIDLGTLFPARFANHENVYQMCFYFLGNSLSIATIKNLVTGVYYESPVIEAHWNSGNSMLFNVHMNNNLNAEVVEPAFSGQLTRFMYGV